ncbi:hypothetical protein BIFDEN_01773 [Bifidobacterium dentium ATCC 27678]|nr:hypothetical protein BIFDEN_01773 [Bifidobacterium dentium ATCC 27678]
MARLCEERQHPGHHRRQPRDDRRDGGARKRTRPAEDSSSEA